MHINGGGLEGGVAPWLVVVWYVIVWRAWYVTVWAAWYVTVWRAAWYDISGWRHGTISSACAVVHHRPADCTTNLSN